MKKWIVIFVSILVIAGNSCQCLGLEAEKDFPKLEWNGPNKKNINIENEFHKSLVYIESFPAIFVDTVRIKSPILANIDNIGFLTSEEYFNWTAPHKIGSYGNTYVTMNHFWSNHVVDFCVVGTLPLSSLRIVSMNYERGFEEYAPKFKFAEKKRGVEIFRAEEEEILVAFYLMRIETVNVDLNPWIEWAGTPDPNYKPRELKAQYKGMEYIQVAFPVKPIK